MFRVEFIGHLGADAEVKDYNGRKFLSFRVAHTDRFTDPSTGEVRETTTWASCAMNSFPEQLPVFLKAGQLVYVRGRGGLRVFSSEKYRTMMAGLDINVSECELVGASLKEREFIASAQAVFQSIYDKGYKDPSEIPVKA